MRRDTRIAIGAALLLLSGLLILRYVILPQTTRDSGSSEYRTVAASRNDPGKPDPTIAPESPEPRETLESVDPVADTGKPNEIRETPDDPAPRREDETEAVLKGRIVDENDHPVPDATVRLALRIPRRGEDGERRWRRGRSWRSLQPLKTDAGGEFRREGLKPGTYLLRASRPDRVPTRRQRITLSKGEVESVVLKLKHGMTIAGRVLDDETSQPLDAVRLESSLYASRSRRATRSIRTEPNGTFHWSGFAPGRHMVRAEKKGYVPEREMFVINEGEPPTDLEFRLRRGTYLSGTVWNAEGQPVPNAWIVLMEGDQQRTTSRTEMDGTYETRAFPPGSYTLFIRTGDYAHLHREALTLTGTGLVQKDVVLQAEASVSGRVLGTGGKPLNGALVRVRQSDGQVRRRANTDEDGRFRIGGLYRGKYELRVRAKRHSPSPPMSFEVTEGQSLKGQDVHLEPGGVLMGTAHLNGIPTHRLRITLVPETDPSTRSGWRYGRSSRDGRFRLGGLAQGTYLLFARNRQGMHLLRDRVDIVPGTETERDLHLERQSRIRGRVVVGPDERESLTVRVKSLPHGVVKRRAKVTETGTFEVENLYPGRYRLRLSTGEEWLTEVTVGTGQTLSGIELRPR